MSGQVLADQRRHGWFAIYKSATQRIRLHFDESPDGLKGSTALAVYGAIVELANDARGEEIEVSKRTLAARACVGENAATDYQAALVAAGVISVERRKSGKVNLPNVIRLLDVDQEGSVAEQATPACSATHGSVAEQAELPEEEKKERETPPAASICDRLAAHVLSVDPGAPVDPAAADWREPTVALLELDRRPPDDVLATIAWLTKDPFWAAKILNPTDLRRHIGRITAVRTTAARAKPAGSRRADAERRDRQRREHRANAGACCAAPGAAPSPAEDEWTRVAKDLRSRLDPVNYEMWLGDAHAHAGAGGELLLAVPEVCAGWVRDRFAKVLRTAAGRKVEVVVCDEPAAAGSA